MFFSSSLFVFCISHLEAHPRTESRSARYPSGISQLLRICEMHRKKKKKRYGLGASCEEGLIASRPSSWLPLCLRALSDGASEFSRSERRANVHTVTSRTPLCPKEATSSSGRGSARVNMHAQSGSLYTPCSSADADVCSTAEGLFRSRQRPQTLGVLSGFLSFDRCHAHVPKFPTDNREDTVRV